MGKEKKEIGKLIELYYEHKLDLLKRDMRVNGATEREIEMADIEKVEEEELEENLNELSELKPFIEWLVENDKIDFRKADADISKDIVLGREPDFMDFMIFRRFADYEKVLMLLSISDTPIEDLLLYLK